MGSSQSKALEPAVSEKLVERLQALDVQQQRPDVEKGYVYVTGEEREHDVTI